jgi:hypothetical protein
MTARPASTRVADFGFNPKGIGGSQTRRIRAIKGRFGPAGKARQLTDEERRAVEDRLRRAGQLGTVP